MRKASSILILLFYAVSIFGYGTLDFFHRPGNADNSLNAVGYFITDAIVNYTQPKYEIGFSVENIFNNQWREAQFETTSRLKNEMNSVTEINYTPGTPVFLKVRVGIFF